jgi:hypothetical protein
MNVFMLNTLQGNNTCSLLQNKHVAKTHLFAGESVFTEASFISVLVFVYTFSALSQLVKG